jgi:hypothetical protein
LQTPLHDAAERYATAARGAWLAANQVNGVLEAIVDKAILASICAAAGTVLAETGVGAVVGYGLAALQVAQIIELIGRAGLIVNTVGALIEGIIGEIMALANQGGDLSRFPLPDTAYHHPARA